MMETFLFLVAETTVSVQRNMKQIIENIHFGELSVNMQTKAHKLIAICHETLKNLSKFATQDRVVPLAQKKLKRGKARRRRVQPDGLSYTHLSVGTGSQSRVHCASSFASPFGGPDANVNVLVPDAYTKELEAQRVIIFAESKLRAERDAQQKADKMKALEDQVALLKQQMAMIALLPQQAPQNQCAPAPISQPTSSASRQHIDTSASDVDTDEPGVLPAPPPPGLQKALVRALPPPPALLSSTALPPISSLPLPSLASTSSCAPGSLATTISQPFTSSDVASVKPATVSPFATPNLRGSLVAVLPSVAAPVAASSSASSSFTDTDTAQLTAFMNHKRKKSVPIANVVDEESLENDKENFAPAGSFTTTGESVVHKSFNVKLKSFNASSRHPATPKPLSSYSSSSPVKHSTINFPSPTSHSKRGPSSSSPSSYSPATSMQSPQPKLQQKLPSGSTSSSCVQHQQPLRVYSRRLGTEDMSFDQQIKIASKIKLKKTAGIRSPGGTPLDRNKSKSGPADLFKSALFQKFKNTGRESTSPDEKNRCGNAYVEEMVPEVEKPRSSELDTKLEHSATWLPARRRLSAGFTIGQALADVNPEEWSTD